MNRVLKRQYDPYEPYEDEYLKVIRNSDDEDVSVLAPCPPACWAVCLPVFAATA